MKWRLASNDYWKNGQSKTLINSVVIRNTRTSAFLDIWNIQEFEGNGANYRQKRKINHLCILPVWRFKGNFTQTFSYLL